MEFPSTTLHDRIAATELANGEDQAQVGTALKTLVRTQKFIGTICAYSALLRPLNLGSRITFAGLSQ
jgi:hypothetical protein